MSENKPDDLDGRNILTDPKELNFLGLLESRISDENLAQGNQNIPRAPSESKRRPIDVIRDTRLYTVPYPFPFQSPFNVKASCSPKKKKPEDEFNLKKQLPIIPNSGRSNTKGRVGYRKPPSPNQGEERSRYYDNCERPFNRATEANTAERYSGKISGKRSFDKAAKTNPTEGRSVGNTSAQKPNDPAVKTHPKEKEVDGNTTDERPFDPAAGPSTSKNTFPWNDVIEFQKTKKSPETGVKRIGSRETESVETSTKSPLSPSSQSSFANKKVMESKEQVTEMTFQDLDLLLEEYEHWVEYGCPKGSDDNPDARRCELLKKINKEATYAPLSNRRKTAVKWGGEKTQVYEQSKEKKSKYFDDPALNLYADIIFNKIPERELKKDLKDESEASFSNPDPDLYGVRLQHKYSEDDIDEWHHYAHNLVFKLQSMKDDQMLLAENLISDVIHFGKLGRLSTYVAESLSRMVPIPPETDYSKPTN